MPDEISVSEAAERLATTGQTIRNYLRSGILQGRRGSDGRTLLVSRKSVESLLAQHGPLNGGRRRRARRSTGADGGDAADREALARERDDLLARVAWLEDALARLREASNLQRQADTQRAEVIDRLLSAMAAAERADELRRDAHAELEDAIASAAMPGNVGRLDEVSCPTER